MNTYRQILIPFDTNKSWAVLPSNRACVAVIVRIKPVGTIKCFSSIEEAFGGTAVAFLCFMPIVASASAGVLLLLDSVAIVEEHAHRSLVHNDEIIKSIVHQSLTIGQVLASHSG